MSDATCSEDGCDRAVLARGLCARDYKRWRAHQPPGWSGREQPECPIDDCGKPVRSNGYCHRHSENLRKYGDPVSQKDRPLEARLRETGWTVTTSGCWEWNGKRNDQGYGIFNAKRLGYENARAHRAVYEWLAGPIPDELLLRHTCDNPPCVNPEHLVPGTHLDNMRDMVDRGRQKDAGRAVCGNGHNLTLAGALKVIKRGNRQGENACVECDRDRKRRYEERQRAGKAS